MGKVNETQMALAINAVNNDGMDVRSAARAYGVKKSTLNDRIHGTSNKSGPRTKLSDFTQRLSVTTFHTCRDIGISLNITFNKNCQQDCHIQQPLDVGVFRAVKSIWRVVLDKHFLANKFRDLTKEMFPSPLKLVVESGFKPEHAISGFRASGLLLT